MVSKTDVIAEVAEYTGITKAKAKEVIESFWGVITQHVKTGSEVQFIGIGKFYKAHRDARKGRSPQTGEEIDIPASEKLAFKSSLKFS